MRNMHIGLHSLLTELWGFPGIFDVVAERKYERFPAVPFLMLVIGRTVSPNIPFAVTLRYNLGNSLQTSEYWPFKVV